MTSVPRARDAKGKAARRDAILRAAERLFSEGGDILPTVAAVAAASGLAKGTVYLYFTSQAQLFLTLLLEGWADVLVQMEDAASGQGSPDPFPIVSAFTAALRDRPALLRLDAYGPAVLEKQSDPEAVLAFKAALAERVVEAAEVVKQALGMKKGEGGRLLMNTYAFARGLWQTSGGSDASPLPAHDPARAILYPAFHNEIERALLAYWRGELSRS